MNPRYILLALLFSPMAFSNEVKIVDTFNTDLLSIIISVNPQYPNKATEQNASGICSVEYAVNKIGKVLPESIALKCKPSNTFEKSCSTAIKLRTFNNKKIRL